jgi:hypothetical protein
MTNEQIRQLTDTIYRALFNADGAALRIRLELPPAVPDEITDDDLRDQMGTLALEMLGRVEDEVAIWLETTPNMSFEFYQDITVSVAGAWARYAHTKARHARIDLLTGKKKDMTC